MSFRLGDGVLGCEKGAVDFDVGRSCVWEVLGLGEGAEGLVCCSMVRFLSIILDGVMGVRTVLV